ncbi:hypothetical protein LPJ70_004910 [Coemansia sp. RSA 2708]|nr:hypothetical protein LPJ70_004910 [Coemansia sp. RSA 2708]
MERLFCGECVYRAYIGVFWFFAASDTSFGGTAAAVEQAVIALIGQVPVLGGRLRDRHSDGLYVDYSTPAEICDVVQCSREPAACTLEELRQSGFDQSRFPMVFDGVPGATPQIDGLAVLQVRVLALGCGGLALGVHCHHTVADATGTASVARAISDAVSGTGGDFCRTLWADRAKVKTLLEKHAAQAPVRVEIAGERQPRISALGMQGEHRRCQIHVRSQELGEVGGSANALAMALVWRAWTRMLVARGSTGAFAYTGGPVDMRKRLGHARAELAGYTGNFILPTPMHARRDFVLTGTLAQVAEFIQQRFVESAQAPGRLHTQLTREPNFQDDACAQLARTDTPMVTFSNMAQLGLHARRFGQPSEAVSVQLRAFDAPHMMFAISDGCGGLLVNSNLTVDQISAFKADQEFSQFARFIY